MVCGYLNERNMFLYIRLSSSVREHHSNSLDWTLRSSARVDPVTTTDVVAPSPWTIFGCQNGMVHTLLLLLPFLFSIVNWFNHVLHAGLRLFKEAKERDSLGRVSIFFSLSIFWKKICS